MDKPQIEILPCELNGVSGWMAGEDGICRIGVEGKQRAFRDRAEMMGNFYKENPKPLPVKTSEAKKADPPVKSKLDHEAFEESKEAEKIEEAKEEKKIQQEADVKKIGKPKANNKK